MRLSHKRMTNKKEARASLSPPFCCLSNYILLLHHAAAAYEDHTRRDGQHETGDHEQ